MVKVVTMLLMSSLYPTYVAQVRVNIVRATITTMTMTVTVTMTVTMTVVRTAQHGTRLAGPTVGLF